MHVKHLRTRQSEGWGRQNHPDPGPGVGSIIGRRFPRLVIDLDPQANATTGLGIENPQYTTNDVLASDQPGIAADAIVTTKWPNVDLIGAELALAERDSLDTALGIEGRLRRALPENLFYDLILIDCPPSVGRLTVNALVAADAALIVTEPAVNATRGVANVLDTIEQVRSYYNPQLAVAGVIVNSVGRTREAGFRLDELRAADLPLWEPIIPARAVVEEAAGASEPIHAYGSRARDITDPLDSYLAQLLGKKES